MKPTFWRYWSKADAGRFPIGLALSRGQNDYKNSGFTEFETSFTMAQVG